MCIETKQNQNLLWFWWGNDIIHSNCGGERSEAGAIALPYVFFVTDEQAREGVSLQAQEQTLREYAQRRGYALAGVYVDDGYSGTTIKRPGLQVLMRDAERDTFDTVIVTKLDRFMRNTRMLLEYVEKLNGLGIGFVPLDQPDLDTSTGNGEMVLTVLGMIARFESRRTGDRVRDVRQHLKSKGHHNGGRPSYGYQWNKDTKKYDIVKEEVAIILRIFDYYTNQNMGTLAVASQLNQERFKPKPRRNNKHGWSDGRIYRILTNEQYISKDDNYDYPAIIEESLFAKTQEKLRLAKKIQRNPVGYLLQGYVFCPICGTRLNIISTRNRAYFICRGNNKQGCCAKSIRESWLEEQVLGSLQKLTNSPDMLRQCIEARLDGIKDELVRLESIV